ncbi:TRAM domain-containing protein [Buchananella felis]|uniref:class I SAM-dependent RNA methyltransferase n=1 Tax=Buchananella felis TaxID=3231492 RepID=UPI0035273CB9
MNEELTLEIGPIAHGGHCVAHTEDGQLVFVRHTAPGERVRARVTKRGRYWQADAVEVLEPSVHRVPSVWPAAGPGGVGGAEFGHLEPGYQRELKAEVITDCLRRTGSRALAEHVAQRVGAVTVSAVEAVEAAAGQDGQDGQNRQVGQQRQGGRTRIEAVVNAEGRLAMHRHASHELVELTDMPLAVPELRELGLFGPDSPWRKLWRPGDRVRAVAPSASPVLVGIEGKFYTADRQEAPATVVERVDSPVGELTYQLDAAGFWQVQRGAPAALVAGVMDLARPQPGERILELYSGAGLFSQALGRAVATGSGGRKAGGGSVVTVEGSPRAVRAARRNCHGLPVTALSGSVDPAGITKAAAKLGGQVDVVVLDPPRAGARGPVMRAVCQLGARAIVLVACDPAALARDCEAATQEGYWPTQLRAWDLFPNTHHVESMVLLQPVGK